MNSDLQTDVVFESRYVAVDSAKVNEILPFVLESIRAVGEGSAVATQTGIQLTYPVDLLKNLVATIEKYNKDGVPTRIPHKVYDANVFLNDVSPDWRAIVGRLELIPSDVSYEFIPLSPTGGVLKFAGPTVHEAAVVHDIVPQVEAALSYARSKVLYRATVSVPKSAPGIIPMIESLKLCPSDMTYLAIDSQDEVLLVFAGPSSRESDYINEVLPSLRRLVGMISS